MLRKALATTKAEETRQRIYEAALRLFREGGFNETTMRDIANEAAVATGASYYYFRSKNDLVMEFYLRTADEMDEELPRILASTRDLKKRLLAIHRFKLQQFTEHRRLLSALFRTGVDPADPLSPFGDETKGIREEAIRVFERAIEGSNLKVPKDLAPHLPQLLWMHQMGLVLFWIFDRSPEQRRTMALLEGSVDVVMRLLALSSLPLVGGLRKSVVKLVEIAIGSEA
jgi:AcrR family transcriptional regulator